MIWRHAVPEHSFLRQVCDAFLTFGFAVSHNFRLHFRNDTCGLPIELLTVRDCKKLLAHLARNACYWQAASHKRKDFFSTKRGC